MIQISQYKGVTFEDLETIFKSTNVTFYKYITTMGLELNLANKDQQKIYLHHFIIDLCNCVRNHKNIVIFHINTFNVCKIHSDIIKKVKKMFGFHVWESPYPLSIFIDKLKNRDVEVVDWFELFLERRTKPKSFKQIKKYLDKEGFTNLSDIYFQDVWNKMTILC